MPLQHPIDLIEFAKLFYSFQSGSPYIVKDFHLRIQEAIYRFMSQDDKNLIINMPPRLGKSKLAVVIFICWILAYMPDCEFIIASNTIALARSHINEMKNCIDSTWYQKLFFNCAKIRKRKKKHKIDIYAQVATSDYFKTTDGGAVKGIGIGGMITGFGAGKKRDGFGGCIIIDDPQKESDYRNQNEMESIYEWYKSTIKFRKNKNKAKILVIMQRLSPDDLSGKLIAEQPDKWEVLKVEGFNEDTQESVWEDVWSKDSLLELRNSPAPIDNYMYYAKFQQEPRIDLSAMIKTSWWKMYDEVFPNDVRLRFITMDTAYKAKTVNDETVIQLWGVGDKKMYLLDMIHGRWEFPEMLQKTRGFYTKHRNINRHAPLRSLFIEDKASGTSLAQTLIKEKINAILWLPGVGEAKDKTGRVLEASKYIARGYIYLPKQASFTKELVNQCAAFVEDNSTHDDMVDATTMAISIAKKLAVF